MSSPADSGIDMKKRRRMQQLKEKEQAAKKKPQTFGMSITQSDIGASP